MKVEIYGTPDCRVCKQAVRMCEANDIEVEYTDLSTSTKLKTILETRIGTTFRTVPQVFVDNKYIPKGFQGLRTIIIDNS